MIIENQIRVLLRSLKLTPNLTFEEFALLNKNQPLNDDGSLPDGKYFVYYRVVQDCHDYGMPELNDYTGFGCSQFMDRLLAPVK